MSSRMSRRTSWATATPARTRAGWARAPSEFGRSGRASGTAVSIICSSPRATAAAPPARERSPSACPTTRGRAPRAWTRARSSTPPSVPPSAPAGASGRPRCPCSSRRTENLSGGALPAGDGAGHGAHLLRLTGLPGEEERVFAGAGQRALGGKASHTDVAVGAAAVGIAAPVVGAPRLEKVLEARAGNTERAAQAGEGAVDEGRLGQLAERVGARPARPRRDDRDPPGIRRPPGREVALAVMDEVDPVRLAQRAPRAPAEEPGIVPEGLAEAEHELADVAHLQLLHRTAQGGRYRVEADRAGLRGRGLQHAERKRDDRGPRAEGTRLGSACRAVADVDPAAAPPDALDDAGPADLAALGAKTRAKPFDHGEVSRREPVLPLRLVGLSSRGSDGLCAHAMSRVAFASPWRNSGPSSTGSGHSGSCRVKMRPPMRGRASSTTTSRPPSDSARAAASPAAPAPMTIVSTPVRRTTLCRTTL